MNAQGTQKILLDCDPGLDDALAILLALGSSKKLDVKAIVATFGNVGLRQTKANLLQILGFFNPSTSLGVNGERSRTINKIPLLGAGSKGPLKADALEAREVHGKDGLGDLSKPYHLRSRRPFRDGIGLIIDLAISHKLNKIIATGPLTDLARAISAFGGRSAPTLLDNLDELIIMGGAVFVKGNVTPYAEFNFHCDPEAAKLVLNVPVKKRLVSLDVTHKTLLTAGHLKPLRDIKGPLARFICGIADYSIRSNKRGGLSGAPMHDPLAVALAIDPGIGEYEELRLDVATTGNAEGRVIVKKGRPNTLFCKSVDVDRFFKLFIGVLTKLAKEMNTSS